MCALFAATYPQRTSALVMVGSYPRMMTGEGYEFGRTQEHLDAFLAEIERDWGKPVGINVRAPSLANDERFRQWWAHFLRASASPHAAANLLRMNSQIDIRHVLPSIRVPTLILHSVGDLTLSVEGGRYLAALASLAMRRLCSAWRISSSAGSRSSSASRQWSKMNALGSVLQSVE